LAYDHVLRRPKLVARAGNVSEMKGIALLGAWLVLLAVPAGAQTNLEYWVQKLDINLIGLAKGTTSTNGVVAGVKPTAVTLSSKEIIQALNGKPVFAVTKGFTNFTVIVTNHVPGPDTYTTNTVSYAVPAFREVTQGFSPGSKLLVLEPLSTNGLDTLLVVRDPLSTVDFEVGRYFQFGPASFDGRTNSVVTQGRFDIAHDLVSATEFSNQRLAFDDNAFAAAPATGTHFEVQGFSQDQQFSLIKNGQIIGHQVRRLATIAVAGTGQVRDTNGFVVLRGTIRISGGRQETKD
jgi:hypothetical protein